MTPNYRWLISLYQLFLEITKNKCFGRLYINMDVSMCGVYIVIVGYLFFF